MVSSSASLALGVDADYGHFAHVLGAAPGLGEAVVEAGHGFFGGLLGREAAGH